MRHIRTGSLYRQYCPEIATHLAQRFGHDVNVIGWQLGNEFTDQSFDAEARHQFQEWLWRRYSTLDALNSAWTTAYWSQTYDRWDEKAHFQNSAPGNAVWRLCAG